MNKIKPHTNQGNIEWRRMEVNGRTLMNNSRQHIIIVVKMQPG